MAEESRETSTVDIFKILAETFEKAKKKRREELLAPLKIREFFVGGSIKIDKRTCKGVECKLCIKACPTNALYWKAGEIGITEELCIYCGACVLNCIVDHCIIVKRFRETRAAEVYGNPREFLVLQQKISTGKRFLRVQEIFSKPEIYIRRYKPEILSRKK